MEQALGEQDPIKSGSRSSALSFEVYFIQSCTLREMTL